MLDGRGGGKIVCPAQRIHLQEQLRHHRVGAADPAVRADGASRHKLLVRPVEKDALPVEGPTEALDVIDGHGGILDPHDPGILLHPLDQRNRKGHARQLGNVVDKEIRMGGRVGDVVPVPGDGRVRQAEVDGRNAGDGVHAQPLGVCGQLAAFLRVVAGHMGDDGTLAAHLLHHGLQRAHPFFFFQIDALPGGAAHVQALHALVHQIAGQTARARLADGSLIVVAGVKRRNHAPVLF